MGPSGDGTGCDGLRFSEMKLRHGVANTSPVAKRCVLRRELTRTMLDRVDFSQAVAKGKDHTVRASGMQEDLPGSRLASRPLEDFYLMRCQKMIVLHQMVDRLDGQTDVEKPDAVAWMKDNPVMDAVEADIRRLADTIGHSGTKDTAPEIDVAVDIAFRPLTPESIAGKKRRAL